MATDGISTQLSASGCCVNISLGWLHASLLTALNCLPHSFQMQLKTTWSSLRYIVGDLQTANIAAQ
jgi:hypothetical protein